MSLTVGECCLTKILSIVEVSVVEIIEIIREDCKDYGSDGILLPFKLDLDVESEPTRLL